MAPPIGGAVRPPDRAAQNGGGGVAPAEWRVQRTPNGVLSLPGQSAGPVPARQSPGGAPSGGIPPDIMRGGAGAGPPGGPGRRRDSGGGMSARRGDGPGGMVPAGTVPRTVQPDAVALWGNGSEWRCLWAARYGASCRRHGMVPPIGGTALPGGRGAGAAGDGRRERRRLSAAPAGTAPLVGGAARAGNGTAYGLHGIWRHYITPAIAGVRGGANAVGRCLPEWNDGQRTAASIDAAARRGGATPWNGAWSVPARARTPSARSGLLGDRAGTLKAAAANALRVHPGPPVAAGPDILVFGH